MRKNLYKMLVTGGAGFIGSEFVRQGVRKGYNVMVVDALTYAGDIKRLEEINGRYTFYKADICNKKQMESIFVKEKPKIIVNFAAHTHVDRSIYNASPFIETNVRGTQAMLDLSKIFQIKKFVQISTDEVYGEIKKGSFSEDAPLNPSSPYAASKAAADLLVKSYIRTYGIPAMIIRPCNNYGPWQHPEKFIPLAISKALKNEKISVYGNGQNVREWLYVSDCIEAVFLILEKGKIGNIYNIGSAEELKNIEVARKILKILSKPQRLIEFIKDRPGHDYRYSLDCKKIREKFSWQAKINFMKGLEKTIYWNIKNKQWINKKLKNA